MSEKRVIALVEDEELDPSGYSDNNEWKVGRLPSIEGDLTLASGDVLVVENRRKDAKVRVDFTFTEIP